MNSSWFGLIEMLLVFGLVGLWCWNELRVLKRDKAAAARRDAERENAPGETRDGCATRSESGEPPVA